MTYPRALLTSLLLCFACSVSVSAYTVQTRTYYIAAEDVEWDYVPSDTINLMTGLPFTDAQNVFVKNGPDRIGHKYKKSLYIEYTDSSFSTVKPREAKWAHLGALGPVIRGVVGDTIKVVFKNNAALPYSIHPHGVQYTKANEGVDYFDGDESKDGVIEPGATYTYEWSVPERAGPVWTGMAANDPSSIAWLYHSHTDEVLDTNTGLIGVIIITSTINANDDGTPKDIDKEFVVLFSVYDENLSHYLNENILTYTNVTEAEIPALIADEDFHESNLKHNINGYLYGNLQGLVMNVSDRVRWYTAALGTEVDLHTPHWHGATLVHSGQRVDVLNLLPATQATADMIPDEIGKWMFHCHVNDHIIAGMTTMYTVGEARPASSSSSVLSPLASLFVLVLGLVYVVVL